MMSITVICEIIIQSLDESAPVYKKSKNPDAYFRRYESQLILYGGARRVLEQAGINLKGLNVDMLKAEYQELMKQKNDFHLQEM